MKTPSKFTCPVCLGTGVIPHESGYEDYCDCEQGQRMAQEDWIRKDAEMDLHFRDNMFGTEYGDDDPSPYGGTYSEM